MQSTVDDLFTADALGVFLTASLTHDDVTGDPRVEVDVPGCRGVYVDRDDLRCDGCDGAVDPPTDAPAKWLGINKALHSGKTFCNQCMRD